MDMVKDIILNNKHGCLPKISHNKELLCECHNLTYFLDDHYNNIKLSQRIYHIKNNTMSIILCNCGNPSKYINRRGKYTYCDKNLNIVISGMVSDKHFKCYNSGNYELVYNDPTI